MEIGWTICIYCSELFSAQALDGHAQDCKMNSESNRNQSPHNRMRPEENGVTDEPRISPLVQPRDRDSEDGSRYIGLFAREEGRMGSHPIHDDYGDEPSC